MDFEKDKIRIAKVERYRLHRGIDDFFVLASFMESPVLVEVVTGAKGIQSQYSLGAVQTPTGAGYGHRVFHQVAGGTFGHAATQFKRIAFFGQFEFVIQWMQTLRPLPAISRTLYRDGSEHRLKLSLLKVHTRPYNPIADLG